MQRAKANHSSADHDLNRFNAGEARSSANAASHLQRVESTETSILEDQTGVISRVNQQPFFSPFRASLARGRTRPIVVTRGNIDSKGEHPNCEAPHCELPPYYFGRTINPDYFQTERSLLSVETWDGRKVLEIQKPL